MPIEMTAKRATGGTPAPLPGSAGQGHDERHARTLPSTALVGTRLGADACSRASSPGRAAVAREREERARAAGHARHAAEELADHRDQDDELGPALAHLGGRGRRQIDVPKASLTAPTSDGRERDRQQHEPADQRRAGDRLPDALGRRLLGLAGLLGDVRRGVVAGDRVHGQQEARRQDEPPVHPHAEAGVVDPLGEDEVDALVLVGHDDQDPDDDRRPDARARTPRCSLNSATRW